MNSALPYTGVPIPAVTRFNLISGVHPTSSRTSLQGRSFRAARGIGSVGSCSTPHGRLSFTFVPAAGLSSRTASSFSEVDRHAGPDPDRLAAPYARARRPSATRSRNRSPSPGPAPRCSHATMALFDATRFVHAERTHHCRPLDPRDPTGRIGYSTTPCVARSAGLSRSPDPRNPPPKPQPPRRQSCRPGPSAPTVRGVRAAPLAAPAVRASGRRRQCPRTATCSLLPRRAGHTGRRRASQRRDPGPDPACAQPFASTGWHALRTAATAADPPPAGWPAPRPPRSQASIVVPP